MAWSVLQSASGSTTTTPLTVTMTSNLTSGSKLIFLGALDTGVNSLTFTANDGNGNNFTNLFAAHNFAIGSGHNYICCLTLDTPVGDVGTKPTISVTVSDTPAAHEWFGIVLEVTGLSAGTGATILDGTEGAASWSNAATATDPTYSSGASNELLIQFLGDNFDALGSGSYTAPTGYISSTKFENTTDGSGGLAWKNSTGGSEAGSDWTFNANTTAGLVKFAIKLPASAAPSLPIPFNPSWLILHQAGFEAFFQQPTPLTLTSIPASPTAGIATVNVGAFNPTVALTGLPATPNVTAAGLAALPLLTGLPDTPNVTVGAFNASVNIAGDANANAGLANVNAAALNITVPVVTALPQSANVTVAANLPNASATGLTVVGAQFPITYLLAVYGTAIIQVPVTQSGTNDTALPQSTNVTVAALGPVPALTGLPDTPNVTATSPPSTAALIGLPDTPNVTAAGLAPIQHVTVVAQVAAVTVTAYNPSVNVGGNVNVTPGVGNVVVAALNASVTAQGNVTANAQLAAVTVAAIGPASNVNPTLTVAAVVIAAFVAAPKIAGRPPTANVVVEAAVLNVSGTGAHIGRLTAGTARTATLTADDSPLSSQDSQDNT
jgi:hypothetical protein